MSKNRYLLLDLFCGAGGCSEGYRRAGFDVVGVDIKPQPHYPFDLIHADAMEFMKKHDLSRFDAIHASPPCQAYTAAKTIRGREHPDLVGGVRCLLDQTGLPWIIENVPGSPLECPVMLCGGMFGLGVYRHRHFETSFWVEQPLHPVHFRPTAKMGRKVGPGEMMTVVGNFSGVKQARLAMGIDWMVRDELSQAIPPAYTEYVGKFLLKHLKERKG